MSGELQTIPARHGVATFVPKGRTIKIINTYGKQVVSAWAFGLGAPPEDDEDEEEIEGMEEDVEKLAEGLKAGKEKEVEKIEKKVSEEVEKPKEDAIKDGSEKKEDKDEGKESKDETGEKADMSGNDDQMASQSNDADDPPEQAPETPENEKATQGKGEATVKSTQKRTWTSYLPSIPYRNKNQNEGKADANVKQETKEEKAKNTATSKKWSSYLPTGKGFSSYVPNVQLPDSQQVVSAFQANHHRDPNKSYAEQLYDFSKTPVGAGTIAAATGSGTASSLYAAYSAYTKLNASRNDQPPMEYLSLPHTRASTNRLIPRVNDTLLTNLRNPIITLIEDTSPGAHDTLTAACDASLYAMLGVSKPAEHGSCAENLVLALKELNEKAGLKGTKAVGADITVNIAPTPLHLFMNAPISFDNDDESGDVGAKEAKFTVQEPTGKKRSFVRFRAERDVVVVLSACPMDVGPQNGGRCMAANFMVEKAEDEDLAASSSSVKKKPAKLNKKNSPAKTESDKTDKPASSANTGGMPRPRGGPAKPAAVQKSAQDARKSNTKDNDDENNDDDADPPESGIPSSTPDQKSDEQPQQQEQQHEPQEKEKEKEDTKRRVEEQQQQVKPKKKPKKLERRGGGGGRGTSMPPPPSTSSVGGKSKGS